MILTVENILMFEALVFGLIVGSFLNVCIYRIPKELSVMGRSFCPSCQQQIPLYRNIPVVTYLFQKGKSHCCQTPISLQYPMIETLTGILSVVTLIHSSNLLEFFLWFLLFICPLIVISIIDFQLKIIPDCISLPFILVGIAVTQYMQFPDWWGGLKFSLLGVLIGGGSLLILAEVMSRIKKTDAMGGGDIKLSAMLGAFLGWKALIFVFFASSIFALVYAILLMITKKQSEDRTIPFGPFLSMGAIVFWLYGKVITDWYFLSKGFGVNPFFPTGG